MIPVRIEQPGDQESVRWVNELAFGRPEEADIVDALRTAGASTLSLVALAGAEVVGHVLFSPVTIAGSGRTLDGMGLGPLAVLPEYQRQGVGSALVHSGLELLRAQACPFVVLVGHPEYYPRFGFEPASRHGIRSQWEGLADEVFMLLVLDGERMENVKGVARFRSEFDEA